jgi:hypothetical protein
MEKKEIYEHLAKIYLDASLEKKKKFNEYPFKNYLFITLIGLVVVVVLSIFILPLKTKSYQRYAYSREIINYPNLIKLSSDTNPIKHNQYHIDLKQINLNKLHVLEFSARKKDFSDKVRLKIKIMSSSKEKSGVYVDDILEKWQDYQIDLKEFKHIKDWTKILCLSFIIEEPNIKTKKNTVYINNVRFVK